MSQDGQPASDPNGTLGEPADAETSYQEHFIEEGEEAEYVAHVESPAESEPPAAVDGRTTIPTLADAYPPIRLANDHFPAATDDDAYPEPQPLLAEPAAALSANEVDLEDQTDYTLSDDDDVAGDDQSALEEEDDIDAGVSTSARASSTDLDASIDDNPETVAAESLAVPFPEGSNDIADDDLLDQASVDEQDLVPADADGEPARVGSGLLTLPLLCVAIALIACCVIIPQADVNRRLAYERAQLRADLESIQTQVATNDEFLRKLAGDPILAERLAQRQLNLQRPGTKALNLQASDGSNSPFVLVQVAPPAAMEPYRPVGGLLGSFCTASRSRLYLMGGGLFMLAASLILGIGPTCGDRPSEPRP